MNIKVNTAESNRLNQAGFTKDQEKAVRGLIEFIQSNWNEKDMSRSFTGSAGTGKTYCIKYIMQNCRIPLSEIGLASPTHKACRILRETTGFDATTIHSDLGLRLNLDRYDFDPDNPPFDPKGRKKIENYRLYILDESSMVGHSLRTLLEKECKKHQCKIIYTGDESQLDAVKDKNGLCLRGRGEKLTKIIRQGEDNPVSDILALLRQDIARKSFTFLEYIIQNRIKYNDSYTKGYEVLPYNDFVAQVQSSFNNTDYERDINMYKIISYTNAAVNKWNKFIRGLIIPNADKFCITKNDLITSYTTLMNEFNEAIISNCDDYVIKEIVNYVIPKYNLKGFLVRFIAVHNAKETQPLFVLDHYDQKNLMEYLKLNKNYIDKAKSAPAGSARSGAWIKYYTFKREVLLLTNVLNSATGETLVSRDADYGFSITSHRSQGSTYENVFVDVNDMVYDKNGKPYTNIDDINRRLYVACSRAKNRLYLCYGI